MAEMTPTYCGGCVYPLRWTTFDPDTLAHDMNVLRDIVKRFGGRLALTAASQAAGRYTSIKNSRWFKGLEVAYQLTRTPVFVRSS